MRIIIDIGHPGQVHYFKNVIKILQNRNHKFLIVARNREFIHTLLNKYGLKYLDRGKGKNGIVGKFLYMFEADYLIYKAAVKFKPDLFLSFSSPYAAQVSFLMGKPHISMNDSEHEDFMYSIFTYPFCNVIMTPKSFQSDLGKKQLRFDNVVEGLYLHEKYFIPNEDIKNDLGIGFEDEYVILRFVSWNAHHDIGHTGLDIEMKKKLINLLKKKYHVFISSEEELPEELKEYKLNISPEKIHDALAFASLFVGESSTMGSESALLGTMAIVINSLPVACNIKTEEEEGVAKYFRSSEELLPFIEKLMKDNNLKEKTKNKSKQMQSNFIDITSFLAWFIEEYPKSFDKLKSGNSIQNRFKYIKK